MSRCSSRRLTAGLGPPPSVSRIRGRDSRGEGFTSAGPLPSCFLKPLLALGPSLTGYAVTAGSFSHSSTTDVVGGAPQDEGVGKVRTRVCATAWGPHGAGGEHAAAVTGLSPHSALSMLQGGRQVGDEALRNPLSVSFQPPLRWTLKT